MPTKVIIAMGSGMRNRSRSRRSFNAKGEKVGVVSVHLYRPFSAKLLSAAIPASVKKIAVLDRTKEMGAAKANRSMKMSWPRWPPSVARSTSSSVAVMAYRAKTLSPIDIKSVYDFLDAKKQWNGFTVGINDDLTHLSIPLDESFNVKHNYTSCLFYGLGSDGTVSANKSSIKIIGDATHQYAQAYFQYDSRKAGGVTRSPPPLWQRADPFDLLRQERGLRLVLARYLHLPLRHGQ
jgi:pyruvate-ferredoxin/flavodoxin oxidoreductase